jgi:membrane protein
LERQPKLDATDPKPKDAPRRLHSARRWLLTHWRDDAAEIYRRAAGKEPWKLRVVLAFLFIRETLRDFYLAHGTARAASLAFATLLSLVPLLVAFSQVLRSYFFRLFPDQRAQIEAILSVALPYRSAEIEEQIARFAENAEAASAFGAIVFVLISFRLFMTVEATFNQIWRVETVRSYRQKLLAFTMLLFWGPLLIGLSFTTGATLQRNLDMAVIGNPIVLTVVPIAVLTLAFSMLFWLVPATKVQFHSALFGAFFTAVAFEFVRTVFGAYVANLAAGRLNVIYGTMGLVVVFLIALEVMWIIILLGIHASYLNQGWAGVLRASISEIEDDPRYDLYFAVLALVEIISRFDRREEAPSFHRLAELVGATDTQMHDILKRLEDARLVQEIGGEWTGFVPGGDPDRIAFSEVINAVEHSRRELPDRGPTGEPLTRELTDLFARLRRCTEEEIGGISLRDLTRLLDRPETLPAPVAGPGR